MFISIRLSGWNIIFFDLKPNYNITFQTNEFSVIASKQCVLLLLSLTIQKKPSPFSEIKIQLYFNIMFHFLSGSKSLQATDAFQWSCLQFTKKVLTQGQTSYVTAFLTAVSGYNQEKSQNLPTPLCVTKSPCYCVIYSLFSSTSLFAEPGQ